MFQEINSPDGSTEEERQEATIEAFAEAFYIVALRKIRGGMTPLKNENTVENAKKLVDFARHLATGERN